MYQSPAITAKMATIAIPAPIPAFAPVDRVEDVEAVELPSPGPRTSVWDVVAVETMLLELALGVGNAAPRTA
jgi:hypothetical protein